ncbi:capsule biosynthesis protein [Agrobacterium pusense]|uniref:Capsule biosynthesis protein n=1 Tax=Agrobacterium pusense TaxID=648995 RepID=A0AA44EHI5_9HYPH|nr:capsule biosynthesis protein [Agrobacterium pusense]NRF07617.1 capsule biosynthesis protein [Agrobacterium pusense]NRF18349.1 capsule biosynthesis protein [Agrobacterium pusense]
MTGTITKPAEKRTEIDQIPDGLNEQPQRVGWLRLYDSGRRRLRAKISPEINIETTKEPTHQPGGKTPWGPIFFVLFVLTPFLASLLYFILIASDQYTSEARFAVRSLADDGSNDRVDAGIINMQSSSQDAYVVTSFIHSAEILRRLEHKIDYRAIFQRDDADFWARFDPQGSHEDFLNYWMKHVTVYIDGPSGIIILKVQTFKPEDSVDLAKAILGESEKLINELTLRAREDMMSSFREEVERTDRLYQNALAKLTRFQQSSGLLNPTEQAQQKGTLLTGLLGQKLEMESQIFVLRQSNKTESPRYRQISLALQSINQQIDNMRSQITGGADASLANVITNFSAVETDRVVAEKLYEAARRNYDQAFAAAVRKALYVTVFVNPAMPEEALYPRRFLSPFLILLGLLTIWTILALIWASIEDHRL